MKRKPLRPDTRLDWRNPDMPVLRLNERRQMIEVTPEYINQFYRSKIADPFYGAPHYTNDPTYDLKKK